MKYNHRHTTFNFATLRTERARSDVCFGTCRVVDLLPHYVDFFDANGLKNWLLDYMRSYIRIFYKKQHNFAEKRSVSINTQSYQRDIYDGLDDNPIANVLSSLSDFSKAFDTVPHLELLVKFGEYGIGGCLFDLLKDYLIGRSHNVNSGNTQPKCLPLQVVYHRVQSLQLAPAVLYI